MKLRSAAVVAGLALGLMSGEAQAAVTKFDYTGGFQSYTVKMSGIYDIVAYGAQGGSNSNPMYGVGGEGAALGGQFMLTQGEILSVAIGGQGGSGLNGGGGGASFVTLQSLLGRSTDTALVIAGGGGGGSKFNGQPGQITPDGGRGGTGGGAGGSGGQGSSDTFFAGAGGGGGFYSNGGDASGTGSAGGGMSYINGLAGGMGDISGGFGGGGAAASGAGGGAGGGGGGYSGGGSGGITGGPGGGGGSYLAAFALNQSFAMSGFNPGDGYVTLEYGTSPVPLPASAPMFGAALLGLAGLGYLAKRKKAAATV